MAYSLGLKKLLLFASRNQCHRKRKNAFIECQDQQNTIFPKGEQIKRSSLKNIERIRASKLFGKLSCCCQKGLYSRKKYFFLKIFEICQTVLREIGLSDCCK